MGTASCDHLGLFRADYCSTKGALSASEYQSHGIARPGSPARGGPIGCIKAEPVFRRSQIQHSPTVALPRPAPLVFTDDGGRRLRIRPITPFPASSVDAAVQIVIATR
jgi:hypothetical protein